MYKNWTRVKISAGLVLPSFSTCFKISTGLVLLYIGHNPFSLKRNSLGPVHKSTGPVEILTHVQKLDKTGYVSRSQRVQCSGTLDPIPSL
jgi:hypothetical protein